MNPSTAIQATMLNNDGIDCIEAKSLDGAVKFFSKGLTMVKQVLAMHGDDEADETDRAVTSAQHDVSDLYFAKVHTAAVSGKKFADKSNTPFIFRCPIVIPAHSVQANNFAYHVKLSFVLLYNLALSHHLSAMEKGNTPKRLQKALSLYELAYTIQMTEDLQLSVMQTMAIVNNLGQIHTALGDHEKAEQCFQHLLSTIMFVNDCGEQERVQQMDGFIANVMPLILKNSAPAPAAAA